MSKLSDEGVMRERRAAVPPASQRGVTRDASCEVRRTRFFIAVQTNKYAAPRGSSPAALCFSTAVVHDLHGALCAVFHLAALVVAQVSVISSAKSRMMPSGPHT